ncbi:unnamed protein product [Amoebophrya sp. A25]|nr:unnamed protein product [Amoebophrya sp. A25]|eukprot:GSA25T00011431001.1
MTKYPSQKISQGLRSLTSHFCDNTSNFVLRIPQTIGYF